MASKIIDLNNPTPTSLTCMHILKSGERCKANPIIGSVFCFNHDPNSSEAKLQAVIKGGKANKQIKVEARTITIRGCDDIVSNVCLLIEEVRESKISGKTANTIGYLLNIALSALKERDNEKILLIKEVLDEQSKRNIR